MISLFSTILSAIASYNKAYQKQFNIIGNLFLTSIQVLVVEMCCIYGVLPGDCCRCCCVCWKDKKKIISLSLFICHRRMLVACLVTLNIYRFKLKFMWLPNKRLIVYFNRWNDTFRASIWQCSNGNAIPID